MIVPQLVNEVALVVGRPVVLEDVRNRMIAYSPQDDRIDPVREATILRHQAGSDVSDWLRRMGALRSDRAVHVPANGALRMLPRLCVPVRADGERLGHLWFIEVPERMTADEVSVVQDFASRIGAAWHRSREDVQTLGRERVDQTVRLLTGSSKIRTMAAKDLGAKTPSADGAVRVLVLGPVDDTVLPTTEALQRGLRAAALGTVRALGGTGFHAVIGRQAVVVLTGAAGRTDADVARASETLLTIGAECLAEVPDSPSLVVGAGGSVAGLIDARASYREARHALRIADDFRLPGRLHSWSALGIYRVLRTAAADGLRAESLQPGIQGLAAHRDGAVLIETLDCYLTAGGHVQDAAAQLNLHRSSLYHRLSRVEKMLGLDLQDGARRLTLHAALILMRLEQTA